MSVVLTVLSLGLRVLLAYVLSAVIGEVGIWVAIPIGWVIYVYLKHQHDNVVESAALMLGSILRGWFGERILGPDKPAVARVKSMCIRKIMIKLENGIDQKKVREYLRMAQKQILQDKQYAALQIFYDVDPQ